MRIARTLAAAVLTLGLSATLTPASQAAPQPATATTQVAVAAKASKKPAPKASTKLDIKAPKSVKAGKTITVTGTLTIKVGKVYKPYAGKPVGLVLLDDREAFVVHEVKTDKKGAYKLTFRTYREDAGFSAQFLTWFYGDKKAKEADSKIVTVKVTR